jgi:Notch-like protein
LKFIFYKTFFLCEGFAGDQCEYDINECQSNPCPKQSTCIDIPNGYSCVCGTKEKQYLTLSGKKNCCYILDPGWTGVDCSEDIDECKTTQPCKAARNCINLPGSYKCECFESFTGFNCEMV